MASRKHQRDRNAVSVHAVKQHLEAHHQWMPQQLHQPDCACLASAAPVGSDGLWGAGLLQLSSTECRHKKPPQWAQSCGCPGSRGRCGRSLAAEPHSTTSRKWLLGRGRQATLYDTNRVSGLDHVGGGGLQVTLLVSADTAKWGGEHRAGGHIATSSKKTIVYVAVL